MSADAPIVRERHDGERRWFLGGGVHIWKLTARDTGGDFFLFEDLLEEGKTTPLHRHPDVAETIYLLEGSIVAHVSGDEREVHAGGLVLFPRGVPHAFRVTSRTARVLCLQTPGTGEAFYRAASEPATAESGPVDFARLRELSQSHARAIEILGPPPFSR